MSVYSILNGLDPRLTWTGMLVVVLMLAGGIAVRFIRPHFGAAWVGSATRAVAIVLGILAGLQLLLAAAYFFYPRYIDWIEPMTVAASWIGWRGGQYYPLLGHGDVMGNWYGPVLFQLNGLMLWLFGPSIASSKILGVAAFVAAQFVSFRVLTRIGASRSEALVITFTQCLLQAGFANQAIAFGVRSDPLLLLVAELGVLVATSAPTLTNAAILGALTALSANLKIQGVFFLFPIFVFFLSQADNTIRRAQLLTAAALAGAASLALPFAAGNVSVIRYIDLFALARHHSVSRWIFEKNIVFLAMCWSPILWLYAFYRPKLPRGFAWFAVACIPAMGMVAVAGAIQASGPYNLLSFVPSLAWLLVRMLHAIREQRGADAHRLRLSVLGMMAAFLIGFAPNLAMAWSSVLRPNSDAPDVRAALAEVDAEMRTHPGLRVEVGPGRYHDLRVIPVFRGNPLPLDGETWYDFHTGGVDEKVIRALIRSCRIELLLLPADEPIFRDALFPDLYSADFLDDFRAHYKKETAGRFLDGWRCTP